MQAIQDSEATKTKIYFLGLLANVDSTLLHVQLEHDFKIEEKSRDELCNFIARLEKRPAQEVYAELRDYWCINFDENKIYTVRNFIQSSTDPKATHITNDPNWRQFENNLLQGYLIQTLRLMRLFKEGNICMPLSFYYSDLDNGTPEFLSKTVKNLPLASEAYSLRESEIPELQSFIQKTKLPFKEDFLNLALESFELSYNIHNTALSFLTLMIGLEVLFNDGEGEISYKISRCTTALLDRGVETYDNLKDLYKKRSQIVHNGKLNSINEDDIKKLRHYLRESIKKTGETRKNKKELFTFLTSKGFTKNE